MMDNIHHILLLSAAAVAAVALIDACISDVRAFRIADRDSILIVVAFFLIAAAGMSLQTAALHVGAAVATFAAGAALFALGVWGGGDVKLCAALALLTGFADLPRFLFVMAVAGGLVALAVLIARGGADRRIPYGLAVAAAGFDWLWADLGPLIRF